MSGFSEEIGKFLEVTLSLIAEVKSVSHPSVDELASLQERRLLSHNEVCRCFTELNTYEGLLQPSVREICDELSALSQDLETKTASSGRPKTVIT